MHVMYAYRLKAISFNGNVITKTIKIKKDLYQNTLKLLEFLRIQAEEFKKNIKKKNNLDIKCVFIYNEKDQIILRI